MPLQRDKATSFFQERSWVSELREAGVHFAFAYSQFYFSVITCGAEKMT